jgi:HNH endonuclease
MLCRRWSAAPFQHANSEYQIMKKYIDAFGAIPLATLPRPKPFYKGFTGAASEVVPDPAPTFLTGISTMEPTKSEVWAKGALIPGFDPAIWRYDICGWPMRFWDFGNRESQFGWESDHIQPESLGGSDGLHNRQPLHWQNNAAKGDNYPWVP